MTREQMPRPEEKESNITFFAPSTRALVVLGLSTLGLYALYWSFKNWKAIDRCHHEKIRPWIKGYVLPSIFVYFLFRKLRTVATTNKLSHKMNAELWGGLYFLASFPLGIPAHYPILCLVGLLPIAIANATAQEINRQTHVSNTLLDEMPRIHWLWIVPVVWGTYVLLGHAIGALWYYHLFGEFPSIA